MEHRDDSTGTGRPAEAPPAGAAHVAGELRAQARKTAASQAREIRLVAALITEVEAAARAELAASGPRVPGQPHDEDVVADAVLAEVQGVLGVGAWWAGKLITAATRLTTVHTDTLAALEAGHLDLTRARQLAAATEWLPDAAARRVEAQVLVRLGEAPWEGPSPRAWRERLARAVVRVAPEEARRRRKRAVRARAVWTWMTGDGTGELRLSAADTDIQLAEEVVSDLALQWPAIDPDDPTAEKLSMDQRRVDALIDLLRRVRDGDGLPTLPVRREHDIGLVLPADSFFADPDDLVGRSDGGPADDSSYCPSGGGWDETTSSTTPSEHEERLEEERCNDDRFDEGTGAQTGRAEQRPVAAPFGLSRAPGQLRGGGGPSYLDAASAAALARREIRLGAATSVMLTDAAGALVGLVRLPAPAGGVWTPGALSAAVAARLDRARPPATDRYSPTAAQAAFVRARNPRCTGYDCARAARRCDLDHDVPWPRGPTDVGNLAPRCRRGHELKTRGLLRTVLHPDGSVTTTTATGLTLTTWPEPLPGYDIAERRPGPVGRRGDQDRPDGHGGQRRPAA